MIKLVKWRAYKREKNGSITKISIDEKNLFDLYKTAYKLGFFKYDYMTLKRAKKAGYNYFYLMEQLKEEAKDDKTTLLNKLRNLKLPKLTDQEIWNIFWYKADGVICQLIADEKNRIIGFDKKGKMEI